MKQMKTFGLRRFLSVTAAALMLTGCLTGYMTAHPLVASAAEIKEGSTAYVTADKLNIRSGPGTNYNKRGSLTQGYKVEVLEMDGDWAKIAEGWVSAKYLNITGPAAVSKGSKVRVSASTLYVRQGPGTQYARVDQLRKGAEVEVLEVDKGWGRIKNGWISLNYVTVVGSSGKEEILPGTGSGLGKGDVVYITADKLNIRSGPGTNYNKRGSLTNGYKVTLLEVDGNWGRIEEGWISLNYVRKGGSSSGISAGDTVQVTSDRLNIRKGPGTNYGRNGYWVRGDRFTIQEVNGSWGKCRYGWVSLNYVKEVQSSSDSLEKGDKVQVTADTLNIRSGAGTNHYRRGCLTRGYQVTLEEVKGNWGRIGEGWICLDYVKAL